jgi:hypothetical protein
MFDRPYNLGIAGYLDILPLLRTLRSLDIHPHLVLVVVVAGERPRAVGLFFNRYPWVKYPVFGIVHVDKPFPSAIFRWVNFCYPKTIMAGRKCATESGAARKREDNNWKRCTDKSLTAGF